MRCLSMLIFAILPLLAQDGQQGSRPGWPCVPGRAVDPAYIETSESSGGQLFLFQKSEVAQSGIVMSAGYSHPATVARAIGQLSGARDIDFPVDSTIESLLVMISLQCRAVIALRRPNGAEMTAANAAKSVDLQAGKIVQVDTPETGTWRIHVEGTGLYVISVQAKSTMRMGVLRFSDEPARTHRIRPGASETAEISFSGESSNLKLAVVGASGEAVGEPVALEPDGNGAYRASITPAAQRFRLVVIGTDANAVPFQRTEPVLFRVGGQ
jgi:hypothetical protein